MDFPHDVAVHRRQRQNRIAIAVHRLMACPSRSTAHTTLCKAGVINRNFAHLVHATQHDARHPHAKPATIVQRGARLGRRLRVVTSRDNPQPGAAGSLVPSAAQSGQRNAASVAIGAAKK